MAEVGSAVVAELVTAGETDWEFEERMRLALVDLATMLVHMGLMEALLGTRTPAGEDRLLAVKSVPMTEFLEQVHTYLAAERSLVVRCKAMARVGSVVA